MFPISVAVNTSMESEQVTTKRLSFFDPPNAMPPSPLYGKMAIGTADDVLKQKIGFNLFFF